MKIVMLCLIAVFRNQVDVKLVLTLHPQLGVCIIAISLWSIWVELRGDQVWTCMILQDGNRLYRYENPVDREFVQSCMRNGIYAGV